jgi:hypothetical protein
MSKKELFVFCKESAAMYPELAEEIKQLYHSTVLNIEFEDEISFKCDQAAAKIKVLIEQIDFVEDHQKIVFWPKE